MATSTVNGEYSTSMTGFEGEIDVTSNNEGHCAFDAKYEFSAPQWYDFAKEVDKGGTDSETDLADRWFDEEHTSKHRGTTLS